MEKRFAYNATVKSVYDGDTMTVDLDLGFNIMMTDQKVRINGIDTPEKRTKNDLEKKAAYAVLTLVEELIGNIEDVVIVSETLDKEKYGRILGDVVTSKGVSIKNRLLEIGYAKPYDGGTKSEWTDTELQTIIEKEALRTGDDNEGC